MRICAGGGAGRLRERREARDERLFVLHHHPRLFGELRRQLLDARAEDRERQPRLTRHFLGRDLPRPRIGGLHAEHRIVFRPRQREVQLRDALAEHVRGFEIAADGVARFGGDAAALAARARLGAAPAASSPAPAPASVASRSPAVDKGDILRRSSWFGSGISNVSGPRSLLGREERSELHVAQARRILSARDDAIEEALRLLHRVIPGVALMPQIFVRRREQQRLAAGGADT